MKSFVTPSPRFVRHAFAMVLLALSLSTATAWAHCDPDNVKHMPCPAPARNHSRMVSSGYLGPKPAGSTTKPHQPTIYTAAKKPAIGPVAPGPLQAASNTTAASAKSSSNFVGGKPTNNKAALNPQPIPPGAPLEHSH